MSPALAADLLVAVHFAFILFVILGGLLVLRWRWMLWLHLPAAGWGALIEFMSWPCPLTPLENRMRLAAGQAGYAHSFIEEYLEPIIYPAGLNADIQIWLGVGVLAINGLIYGWVLRRRR